MKTSEGATRRKPPFPKLDAAVVGEQVAEAIEANRFFLPNDPGVVPYMVALASDPDAFIDAQIKAFAEADSAHS